MRSQLETPDRGARLLRAFCDGAWAILPEKLDAIGAMLARYLSGERLPEAEVLALRSQAPEKRLGGGVAVLPIFGVLARRANMLTEVSGGTSIEQIRADFCAVMADSAVGSVILQIDSPGGEVGFIPELAEEILRGRESKPIIAQVDPMAASAAYWLAAAASEVVITPSGQAGSIGVYAVHTDVSKLNETLGVAYTYVSAGKHKVELNPDEALSAEARAHMQETVDAYYGQFVSAVAKGRGVPVADVRNGFGEGRMVTAKEAVRLGLADRVATFDETLARMVAGKRGRGAAQARGMGVEIVEGRAAAPRENTSAQPSDLTSGRKVTIVADGRRSEFEMIDDKWCEVEASEATAPALPGDPGEVEAAAARLHLQEKETVAAGFRFSMGRKSKH